MRPFTPSLVQPPDSGVQADELRAARPAARQLPEQFTPPARLRSGESSGRVGDKYERMNVVSGQAGTGGARALLGAFAGTPDALDIVVTGGAAIIELRDMLAQVEAGFTLPVGGPYTSSLSRRFVLATNVSDASQATVVVIGKWANPREAVNGTVQFEDEPENLQRYGTLPDDAAAYPVPY